jgi:hypothetical protein
MFSSLASTLLALFAAQPVGPSDHSDAIVEAYQSARACSPEQIKALFAFSLAESREAGFNATNHEALGSANEAIFLQCPEQFLIELDRSGAQLQQAVLDNFGDFEVQEIACKLAPLASERRFAGIVARIREQSSIKPCDVSPQ